MKAAMVWVFFLLWTYGIMEQWLPHALQVFPDNRHPLAGGVLAMGTLLAGWLVGYLARRYWRDEKVQG